MTGGDLLTLVLYLVQQLGVMLGVGAATIMLVIYLMSKRDGVIESAEEHFARMVGQVLAVGLLCIISSGVAITALHSVAGEAAIIFTPAFIFKWLLIGIVSLPLIVGQRNPFAPVLREGFFGATWFALFILHVVAPIASWPALLLLYAVWVGGFLALWLGLAHLLHADTASIAKMFAKTTPKPITLPKVALATSQPKPSSAPKPIISSIFSSVPKVFQASLAAAPKLAPKPVLVVNPTPPPPPTKPVEIPAPIKLAVLPPAPLLPVPEKPALDVPFKPAALAPKKPEEKIEDPDQHPDLPAVRVMPRTPEDIQSQDRATVVQFS